MSRCTRPTRTAQLSLTPPSPERLTPGNQVSLTTSHAVRHYTEAVIRKLFRSIWHTRDVTQTIGKTGSRGCWPRPPRVGVVVPEALGAPAARSAPQRPICHGHRTAWTRAVPPNYRYYRPVLHVSDRQLAMDECTGSSPRP